ncbi:MAG: hypothetical protein WKG01_29490 [Kofleriaceae bacterium]
MSGPKRNPDKLNTIGVVVVGICGAVLVYVTIVALQAFYMDDTSEIQTMADYGGQDTTFQALRSQQRNNISEPAPNPLTPSGKQTYRIPIDEAMKIVVTEAKLDPANLVPSQGRSDRPTALPIYGRPKEISTGSGAGSAAQPAPGAGSGSATADGAPVIDAPTVKPTATGGQGPGGGAPKGTQGRPVSKPGVPTTSPAPAGATPPKGNAR